MIMFRQRSSFLSYSHSRARAATHSLSLFFHLAGELPLLEIAQRNYKFRQAEIDYINDGV